VLYDLDYYLNVTLMGGQNWLDFSQIHMPMLDNCNIHILLPGHCLVVWDEVTMPKRYGGLGIPNLRLLNIALRCRWAWLQWTDPNKAWVEFDL
jgi:hypothetical protein